MKVDRVVALLKDLEGWRDYVYDDRSPWPRSEVTRLDCRLVAGQYKVNATGGTATVGYGETSADFIDLYWGRRITQPEALAKMAERVQGFHAGVLRCITADLTEHQWEAITCRAYQTGAGGFCRSETAALLNAGYTAQALAKWSEEFAHPDRSEVEIAHFLTPDEEKRPMETWHPRAIDAPANRAGSSFIGVAPKVVLHTVEGRGRYSFNPSSYYGNPYWPHCTIDGAGIHQHLPIDVSGFALANSAGGAETNRANAIQCEILWFSAEIADLPLDIMGHLADWVGWVLVQTGAPLHFAQFRGPGSYGENAPQRFGAQEWLNFTGICGHQHVPENDHWDPGAFPVDQLRRAIVAFDTPNPVPVPQEEDDMALPLFGDSPEGREGGLWMLWGGFRKRVHTPQVWDDYQRLGSKHIGDVLKESGGKFPVAMFDGTIDIEAALAAKVVVTPGENGAIDYEAVGQAVADELYGRLAG